MKNRLWMGRLRACLVSAALFAPAAFAADDPALLKDMTSVIALLGLPCGQAISASRQAENDHLVTCKDGNRYRVYQNAEGRVVAEKTGRSHLIWGRSE